MLGAVSGSVVQQPNRHKHLKPFTPRRSDGGHTGHVKARCLVPLKTKSKECRHGQNLMLKAQAARSANEPTRLHSAERRFLGPFVAPNRSKSTPTSQTKAGRKKPTRSGKPHGKQHHFALDNRVRQLLFSSDLDRPRPVSSSQTLRSPLAAGRLKPWASVPLKPWASVPNVPGRRSYAPETTGKRKAVRPAPEPAGA